MNLRRIGVVVYYLVGLAAVLGAVSLTMIEIDDKKN